MTNRAEVKIDGLPDDFQYTDIKSLLEFLVDHLVVEIPDEITNVVVGNDQPSSSERDSIWIRRNNAGVFVGIYLYSDGQWSQFFPAPKEVIWMYGRSDQIPAGYAIIDDTRNDIDNLAIDAITNRYIEVGGGGYYVYFAVTFTGI